MIKKYLSFLLIYSAFLQTFSCIHATDHYPHTERAANTFEEIDFGDLDFSLCETDFLDTPCDIKRSIDPAAIIGLLEQLDAFSIFQEQFFLRTNGLNNCSLLDRAILGDMECCRARTHIFGADIFWNHTDRSFLTKSSDKFCSYLAIQEASLLDKIQNAIDKAANFTGNNSFNLDVEKILGLFACGTVQQRRTGIMFFGTYDWHHATTHNLITRFMIPVYYLERNYFLTQDQQDAITAEFGKTDPDEQETLQKNHLISDKVCVGDTRLYLETPVFHHWDFNLNFGLQLTIPTAFNIYTGIKGRDCPYPTSPCLPPFDLDNLFEILFDVIQNQDNPQAITQAQIQIYDILNAFVLGALDRMSANLLDAKPGNGGHLGIGILYRSQTPLSFLIKRPGAQKVQWLSKVSLEYLLPATEKRFFIKKNDPAAFAERDFANTNNAQSNVEFLADLLVSKLYLVALDARVRPGFIFHSNNKFCYQGPEWGVNIGSDFWFQWREKIQKIHEPCTTNSQCTLIPCNQLDTNKAKLFYAYQSKIFGGITHQWVRPHATWFASLNLESTVVTSGIGHDYTIAIKIERHF
jgi:hypothetical protein